MAKLVLYKPAKPLKGKGVLAAHSQKTLAINQSGVISNSIGKIVMEMKSIASATVSFQKYQEKKQKKLARLEKDKAAENLQEGKILPDGPPEGNINEGKNADLKDTKTAKGAMTWMEQVFGPFLNVMKDLITLVITKAVFDFMKNPKNAETVQWVVETTGKVFKFLAGWVKGSVENLLDGMGKVFDSNAPFWDRIKGFGQMLMGFLGLAALMNPFGLMMGIITIVQNLAGWFEKTMNLVKSFRNWWQKKAGKAGQKGVKAVDKAKDAIKGVDKAKDAKKASKIDDIMEGAGKVGRKIADSKIGKQVTGAIDNVGKFLDPKKLKNLLPKVDVGDAKKGIGNFFSGIGKNIQSGIDWAGKQVTSKWAEAQKYGKTLQKKLNSRWGDFGNWLKKAGSRAKEIMIEKVLKPAKKHLDPLMKRMTGVGDTITKALRKIPGFEWVMKLLKKKGAKGIFDLGPVLKQIGPKAIDIIGGVVNMVFAYDRFAQGDTVGGLIEGASGILDLSALPPPIGAGFVLGPKLSLGMDAYMFARDLLPDFAPEADLKAGEDAMIKKLGLGGIKGKIDSLFKKLPDLSTIMGWLTGNKDAKDPDTENEDISSPNDAKTASGWEVNEDNVISGDKFIEGGGDEFSQGGPFTRIPEMASGGALTSMSESNALEEEDEDATPFAFPITNVVPIFMPMPINSSQEVIQGQRSPLLDKV